jgi:hypothetical protein
MKKKTKSIMYAIGGIIILFYGCYVFLTDEIIQNIIMGFTMMCIGSGIFGWNMAWFTNKND